MLIVCEKNKGIVEVRDYIGVRKKAVNATISLGRETMKKMAMRWCLDFAVVLYF
jgi:hypothetical protein